MVGGAQRRHDYPRSWFRSGPGMDIEERRACSPAGQRHRRSSGSASPSRSCSSHSTLARLRLGATSAAPVPRQTNIGTLAVFGFFVLSGLLITRSARRAGVGRYCWHRALRIFPGLWVCLLVTAFVVAPLVALREHGTLDGFWTGTGAARCLRDRQLVDRRAPVRHPGPVPGDHPVGRKTGGPASSTARCGRSCTRVLCYILVGVLAVTGGAAQRPPVRAVACRRGAVPVRIVVDFASSRAACSSAGVHRELRPSVAFLGGGYSSTGMVYLGFLFVVRGGAGALP